MPSYQSGSFSLGLGYIDPSDAKAKDHKQMLDWFYNANYTGSSAIWLNAAIDKRFKTGDPTLYSESYGQNYQQYQKFFFNLVRRHGNMISGYQRKNRKSTITIPNQQDTDELSDDFNKSLRWCEDRDNFQEYFSESFENGIDVGINWLWLYPDYTYDPISGDLLTDCVSQNNVLWDQNFHKQDMTDMNGIWRRRWVSKQSAQVLLPGYASEIKKMRSSGAKDGRFPLQAELQNLQLANLFTYDEFYYRSTRRAKLVIDPYSGESMEWEDKEDEPDDMMQQVLQQQPWLRVIEKDIPTVKMVIKLGDHVVYHGNNFLNIDEYPTVPHLCYHEPDILSYSGRIMGYIRNLRDAQFLYNMRKVIELQILQSQVNAGWIYPVDAVVDSKAFRQNSGGDGWLIPLKAGRLPNEIQRIEPSALPASLMELSKSLAEDITNISGVNEELLGMAQDDKAGILAMLRQSAGLVTLQSIFDRSDLTQRLYGKIRLKAIRKNFSKGKIRNILGHDPDPRFFNDFSQKYGIAVEEGNYSTTQRQTELQQYLYFKELGMPIADKTIMRAAFITNKKLAMQEMEEQTKSANQQQQAQMEQQAKIDEIKGVGTLAKAKLDMASVQEKMANINEINSQAEKNEMESDLGLVKMAMELEDIQFNQIKSAFDLAISIKQAQQAERESNMAIESQKQRSPGGIL
jgi:hypothetical protein